MKTALLIAFEYPPAKGAGVERTLALSKYLPEFGWKPVILTVKENAYDHLDQSRTIPDQIHSHVFRTSSFNASRDLSFRGRYPGFLNVPDKWASWVLSGVLKGREIIEKYKPEIIWSTYPIASAHLLALILNKLYKIPWVCDFRDPMPFHYSGHLLSSEKVNRWIEKKVIKNCSSAVFVTREMAELYSENYYNYKEKFTVVENGYDESKFQNIEYNKRHNPLIFQVLHSGYLYEDGRNPKPLFNAISELKKRKIFKEKRFQMVFRGVENSDRFKRECEKLEIADFVRFLPPVDYRESLEEMFNADALVVIQDELFKHQIPGKVYDYLRVKKPIICVSPVESAVGKFLQNFEFCFVGQMPKDISLFIEKLLKQKIEIDISVEKYSRYQKTKEISDIFTLVSSNSS